MTQTSLPWVQIDLPESVTRIRSMLSRQEKQYLTWLTSEKYEGWGAIVELGVWLGSSSASLAEGLRRRGISRKIRSFDLFVWEDYMAAETSEDLKRGDDFLPVYLREIGEYRAWIEPEKVDLLNCSWSGGPIEILFVDSAKSWDLANAVLRVFGPHLVPGRSRVVLQDFRYHYAHCLPLIFDSRPDLWKQVEDVPNTPTVTFMPLLPIDLHDYSEESFPLPVAERILRDRMAREHGPDQVRMLEALYRKYIIDGPIEEALQLRAQVLANGATEADLKVLEDVGFILHPRGWKAYESGDYAGARAVAERCLAIPGMRSVYAWTLLGFALLRLGDLPGTRRAIQEILALDPEFPSGLLLDVELALSEGRYSDAESGAKHVLNTASDPSMRQWAGNLMSLAENSSKGH